MVADSMSKQLWIKKLGIPACVAGVAVGALAWQVTEQQGEAKLVKPAASHKILSQAPAEAGGMPSCCMAPAEAMSSTKPMKLPASLESGPAVCPMGYTSEPAQVPAPAPAPAEAAPAKPDTSFLEATPRFRLLATVAQAGKDSLALPDPAPAPAGDVGSGSLDLKPDAAPADVDSLIDNIALPEYTGKSKTFNKIAPRVEEKKAEEAAAKKEEEGNLIPEPLFPPLAQPLVTVEDYKKRLEVVEGVGRDVANTAERVNNTAGQWKDLYDKSKATMIEMNKQIEELKARNRQLLIEKSELMKNPSSGGNSAKNKSAAASVERAKNLDKPLLNITEKDLGLPERKDIKDLARALPPPPPPLAQPVAPRVVRAPDGTVYEGNSRPNPNARVSTSGTPVPITQNAPRPVAKPNTALANPALGNLPAPFPGSQTAAVKPKPTSEEELTAYKRWQRENGQTPAAAPAATTTAPSGTASADEKKWEWDPVTGSIRRSQ